VAGGIGPECAASADADACPSTVSGFVAARFSSSTRLFQSSSTMIRGSCVFYSAMRRVAPAANAARLASLLLLFPLTPDP
jgi:hypothetical protein